MRFFNFILVFGAAQMIAAQRPANTSICDYYTTSIFKDNTAASQQKLITRMFNEAVRGNYTTPNIGVPVPGFATPAFFNGTWVNLIQYFTGQLNSTNGGGAHGISRIFLDDGGAAPLGMDLPSNGNTSSYQYLLFTHAYHLWGELLGCSQQGTAAEFPLYNGKQSMYEVHKYMNLDSKEMGFFIAQNVLSSFAIGFSASDAAEFGNTLTSLFAYRCSPPRKIAPSDAGNPSLQSTCIAADCPIDPNGGDCSLYPDNGAVKLFPVNITSTVSGSPTTTFLSGTSLPVSSTLPTSTSPTANFSAGATAPSNSSSSGAFTNKIEKNVWVAIMTSIIGAMIVAICIG